MGLSARSNRFKHWGISEFTRKPRKVNKTTYITFTLPPTINDSLIKYGRDFFKLSPNALRYNEAYFLRIHLCAKRPPGAESQL